MARLELQLGRALVYWWQNGTTHRTTMPTMTAERVRLTARIPGRLRDTLEQAAELQGATLNQFVVQSAFAEAQRVLERETQIQLSQRDAQRVFGLLAHPPKPNRTFKAAVRASRTPLRD